jgi:hypothetical protein
MTPAWILDLLAALMLTVAVTSAARLVMWRLAAAQLATSLLASARGEAGADVGHLLMGVAMAGALASSLATVPDVVWAAVFAVMTAWFAYRLWRQAQGSGVRALGSGHCAPHLAHAAAMLYMFLAVRASGGIGSGATPAAMGPMGAAAGVPGTVGHPALALVLAVILIGLGVWDLDQVSRRCPAGRPQSAVCGLLLSPVMTVASRVVMGATMAFMLVTMT